MRKATAIIIWLLVLGCIGTAAWWLTGSSETAPSRRPTISSRQAPTPIEATAWREYATRSKQIGKIRAELLDNLDELRNRSMAGGDLDRYQFVAECERWLKNETDVREDIRKDFIRALRVELRAEKIGR